MKFDTRDECVPSFPTEEVLFLFHVVRIPNGIIPISRDGIVTNMFAATNESPAPRVPYPWSAKLNQAVY